MRLGIVGGTAFEDPSVFLADAEPHTFSTDISSSVTYYVGTLTGTAIETVYVRRHGKDHEAPPHRVSYGAHATLMRDLDVDLVLGTAICGSLREDLPPGSVVIPDQVVDLSARPDIEGVRPEWLHLPFGEPYCPQMRGRSAHVATGEWDRFTTAGCIATINGPRFASGAEARWLAAQGWDLVNMTQATEAYAFRQAERCYLAVAFVTDYAYGLDFASDASIGSSMGKTLEVFRSVVRRGPQLLTEIARAVAGGLPGTDPDAECRCRRPMPDEYYKAVRA